MRSNIADADRTERGHQQTLRLRPVRLVVIGGEQAVAAEIPQNLKRPVERLGKSRLVANLVHQSLRAKHNDRLAEARHAEDRAVNLRQSD
jgi:hypothetical protein